MLSIIVFHGNVLYDRFLFGTDQYMYDKTFSIYLCSKSINRGGRRSSYWEHENDITVKMRHNGKLNPNLWAQTKYFVWTLSALTKYEEQRRTRWKLQEYSRSKTRFTVDPRAIPRATPLEGTRGKPGGGLT